jgi:hypothetical protein
MLACILRICIDPLYWCIWYDFRCFDNLWLDALVILINVYSTFITSAA